MKMYEHIVRTIVYVSDDEKVKSEIQLKVRQYEYLLDKIKRLNQYQFSIENVEKEYFENWFNFSSFEEIQTLVRFYQSIEDKDFKFFCLDEDESWYNEVPLSSLLSYCTDYDESCFKKIPLNTWLYFHLDEDSGVFYISFFTMDCLCNYFNLKETMGDDLKLIKENGII